MTKAGKTLLTPQASVAATCIALLIIASSMISPESVSDNLRTSAVLAVAGFVAVCVIDCYVTGGCDLLAWAFVLVLIVSVVAALSMARMEHLVVDEGGVAAPLNPLPRPVKKGALPPP